MVVCYIKNGVNSYEYWDRVKPLLRQDWSPEQISLWLCEEKRLLVSHEWVYQYVPEEKNTALTCIAIYVARSRVKSAMVAIAAGVRCRLTVYPSINALPSWRGVLDWVIENLIR